MRPIGYMVVGPYGEVSYLPLMVEEGFARELVARGWGVYRAITA